PSASATSGSLNPPRYFAAVTRASASRSFASVFMLSCARSRKLRSASGENAHAPVASRQPIAARIRIVDMKTTLNKIVAGRRQIRGADLASARQAKHPGESPHGVQKFGGRMGWEIHAFVEESSSCRQMATRAAARREAG